MLSAFIRGALFVLLLSLTATAPAQDAPPLDSDPTAKALELQDKAFDAIGRRDYDEAERLLRRQLELDPGNFVPHYNLACVLALKGDAAACGEQLLRAVEHGFSDVNRLRTDPDLANARNDENYLKIVNNWGFVLEKHRDANLSRCKQFFKGGSYLTGFDEELRLAYLSAADPKSFEQAREDITRLARWGVTNVFPDLALTEPQAGETPAKRSRPDAWVVVILPTPDDFQRWSRMVFGPDAGSGMSTVGGIYSHDSKRLVAMDLGATLRHEFFHVLHWRSCERLGQPHPPWIQEGLCSLVEDYEVRGSGDAATIEPVPSWRTNVAKRLARSGRLTPIKTLAAMSRESFIASRPLAQYGQARAVFLFLWQQGKLKDWYAAYTRGFKDDPTGVHAIEEVFERPMAEVEKLYRDWLKALPEVAEQISPGSAGLGAEVEPGDGDGPVIVQIDPRGPARRAGLRVRDAITAINGQPTRDLNELVRVLGELELGDAIEVSYRRGRQHGTVQLTLSRR
ncbi:MAG: PDZ domain-containing protein [Phycisphaerales bacterium]